MAKYCYNCGFQVDENAEICPECGVRQENSNSTIDNRTKQGISIVYKEQQKNPVLAAVLSALVVGIGQIYNGENSKGLKLLAGYIISWFLVTILIGLITTPILWVYGIYDAYKTAEKINRGEIIP